MKKEENCIPEETAEELETTRTREVVQTEHLELGLLEDEFLDEFERDNGRRR